MKIEMVFQHMIKDKKENVVFDLGWLSTKDTVRSDTFIRLNYKALWFSGHHRITPPAPKREDKSQRADQNWAKI